MNGGVNIGKAIVGGLVVLAAVVLVSCSMTTVDTGHRGVKVQFGKVIGQGLPEGLYFINPVTTQIVAMDTRIQKWEGDTQAYTKDVQQATVHFTLTYRLDPTKAHVTYQSVGRDWENKLISQVVLEEIKREFGQYEAVDLIGKRDAAARKIETDIVTVLADRNVVVTGFQLTNIDYTPEFEHSVEAKVVAQQRAIEEQNRTVQIEQQAKQKVIQAEAEARSMQIRAQALEANPKLVEWEAVQKWDGHMPQYMLGGSVPFIQVPTTK